MKKVFFSVLSLLLTSTFFYVPIFASENNDHGALFNQYSEKYLEEIAYLADNIVEVGGAYILNIDENKITKQNLLKDMRDIVETLNNTEIIEISNKNEIIVHHDDEITSYKEQNAILETTAFAFGNRYWWGYAYTLIKSDLQWIAQRAGAVGSIAALAMYLPEATWSKAIAAAGRILAAVGGTVILLNLSYLTFSVWNTGTVWVDAKW